MKAGLVKSALPWLVLALMLPMLVLAARPVAAVCSCGGGAPPPETRTIWVDVSPQGAGDVEVARQIPESYPVSRIEEVGDIVRLVALPADGYYFVGWSGDLSGNETPVYVRTNDDQEITAHFFPEEIFSPDSWLHLVFPIGTVVQGEDGEPLDELDIHFSRTLLPTPAEASLIGHSYEIGPDGASFDQPVSLSCSYDPAQIPDGVAEEELYVAYYNERADQWRGLPSTVDAANDIVTAQVVHLSVFSVAAPVPPLQPASFTVSSLTISPLEVDIGEAVSVSVLVTNSGEVEGSYYVVMSVNGTVAGTTVMTMAGGSQTVSFSTTGGEAGIYSVEVNGLEGSFTVRETLVPITSTGGFPGAVKWTLIGLAIAAFVYLIIGFIIKLRRWYYDYYY
jgi:uncharacterized repeat protein (TIGR02543 family)